MKQDETTTSMRERLEPVGEFLRNWGVLVAFVVLLGFNMLTAPEVFMKPEAIRNLFSQSADWGIIALGMTLVIIAGGIDLSVGSLLALCGVSALLISNKMIEGGAPEGQAVAVAIAINLGVGLLFGSLSGLLVSWARIAPFVATLIGLGAFRSLALVFAEGGVVNGTSREIYPELAAGGIPLHMFPNKAGNPLMIQWPVIAFIVLALVLGFVLNKTKLGRHIVAVGSNERAAHYSAVPVAKVKFATYAILGLCVGLGALANSSRLNSVPSSSAGNLYELDAIAAVVIGGTALTGGRGRIWGTFVGVLLLGMIYTMLVAKSVSPYWSGAVKGGIILLAVLIQRSKKL